MPRRIILTLIGLVVVLPAARAAEPLPAREAWVPQEALLVLDVHDPKPILDLLLDPKLIEAVKASPPYRAGASSPQFAQMTNAIQFLEARLETKWPEGLVKLLGGGFTLAVGPKGTTFLLVDAQDAEMLRELNDVILFFAKDNAERRGDAEAVSSGEYRGVTGWKLGPNEAHTILDNRLLVSNKSEGLKAALDLRAEPDRPGLARSPGYQAAKRAAGSGAAATLYVNSGVLKNLPQVQNALAGDRNPLAVLLLAGLADAVQDSTWLGLALDVSGDKLVLRLATDGTVDPSGAGGFAIPPQAGGAMPNLVVPRGIAAMSFYRDLHGFYAAKDELFPERTSGLIFFENMMGIFFTGRDLTEEVLAQIGSDVRLVVARQEYRPENGTPAVQIPCFAAVFRMKDPDKFARVAEEGWQKAVGLVNFSRGQQAKPGLIIDRPVHNGVKYTSAAFSPPEGENRSAVDVRFNFSPSLAMTGEYLVFSSTAGLAEDLIDALGKETQEGAAPLAGTHSLLELDAAQLASILGANREGMIRQNMVEKGNTREQAEQEIGTLLTIIEHVGRVKLDVGIDGQQTRAALEVHLNLP